MPAVLWISIFVDSNHSLACIWDTTLCSWITLWRYISRILTNNSRDVVFLQLVEESPLQHINFDSSIIFGDLLASGLHISEKPDYCLRLNGQQWGNSVTDNALNFASSMSQTGQDHAAACGHDEGGSR